MRILALNQFYRPDPAPTAVLLADVCTHMAARGHDVHVVCGSASYAGAPGELPAEENVDGVHVHRVSLPAVDRASLVSRAGGAVSFHALATARALRLPRADEVLVKSTPPLLASVGLALKAAWRTRLVYWVQDLYPDVAVALGAVRAGSSTVRVATRVAQEVARRCDALVALGPAMKERLVGQGAAPERVRIIDNWQDETRIRPWTGGPHPLREGWGNSSAFSVMYSGNMGLAHDFATLEEAVARLGQNPGVDVTLVGAGAQRDEVEARLRARNAAGHVRFLPLFPAEELPVSLSAPDVHLVSLHAGMSGMVVPSKVYGVLAAGVPAVFVGPRGSDAWRLYEDTGAGLCVENGDVDGLVAALLALRDEPLRRAEMGRRARAAAEGRYGRNTALERWVDVLEHR